MKNLIRGHIYQLKKDRFFFGCLALACILLGSSIRLSFSLASTVNPVMGVQGLFDIFLGGDTVLYVFMVADGKYRRGNLSLRCIKNIIGRGIAKKQYYLSIVFLVSAAYLLVMLAGSVVMGTLLAANLVWEGFLTPLTMLSL